MRAGNEERGRLNDGMAKFPKLMEFLKESFGAGLKNPAASSGVLEICFLRASRARTTK
jgi:hypothetical protein